MDIILYKPATQGGRHWRELIISIITIYGRITLDSTPLIGVDGGRLQRV